MNSNYIYKRIKILAFLFIMFIAIFIITTIISSTISRYIKREQDEIYAYYTSLYFGSDGHGKIIALENNEGFVDFSLMNFEGEDVTQRDIEYVIHTPSVFYDQNGNEIAEENLESQDKLYVLDVWGEPKEIEKNSYLYNIEILNNDGEKGTEKNSYLFSYEKYGTSGVGKTHHLNLKLQRAGSELDGTETISIVVQLIKPYREVYIINMIVSNRLITFSTNKDNKFDIDFRQVYVQTADLFAYTKDGQERKSKNGEFFTSYAFKIILSWSGALLDENELDYLHNVNKNELGNDFYLDIKKPVLYSIEQNNNSGQLVMYVPQSSNFSLNFLETNDNVSIDVEMKLCVRDDSNNLKYVDYDEYYYGYTLSETKSYQIYNSKKEEMY